MKTIIVISNSAATLARKAVEKISRISVVALVIVLGAIALGLCVGHEINPIAGVICVPVVIAILAAPSFPFLLQWGFNALPPELARMVHSNAEIAAEDLARMFVNLRAEINSLLASLSPLEQFEVGSELAYGLRTMRSAAAQLLEIQEALSTAMSKYTAQQATKAEKEAEGKLIEKGEYIKKTDAETATKSAVENKEKEIKDAQANEKKDADRVAAARAKLVADKVCTESAAAALSTEFFKEDGYADRTAKLAARLKTLADNKINHSEPFVAEMVALSYDEAGEKSFQSRVDSVKNLVASTASRPNTQVAPLAVAGAGGGDSDSAEIIPIF